MKTLWQHKLPQGHYVVSAEKPVQHISVKQIHTDQVAHFLKAQQSTLEADGIYWHWHELTEHHHPMVLTADCLPLTILGKKGGAILHAGWRGVKAQIYFHPKVVALEPTYFYIGPSIQVNSFEVTNEFLDYFPKENFRFDEKKQKYTFNLQQQVVDDLTQRFPQIKGEVCPVDTFTDLRFKSFRRDKMARINNYNYFSLYEVV